MSMPITFRLTWAAAALTLAMLATGMVLTVLNSDAVGANAMLYLVFGFCAVIGAMAVPRQPRNLVTWLFLAVGLIAALDALPHEIAIYLFQRGGSSAVVQWLEWPDSFVWVLCFGPFLALVPLLFPDGRLPSRRWRPVAWLAVACIVVLSAVFAIQPGRFDKPKVANPAGLAATRTLPTWPVSVLFAIGIALIVTSVCSLVVRYRRADGDVQHQVKWFGYGAFVSVADILLGLAASGIGVPIPNAVGTAALLGIPVGAGIGVLRFRLFDIDLVISKTIVYGSLAALITGVYMGLVVGVGQFAGASGTPALSAVAAAIVALAFHPVRARLQRLANKLVYGQRATPYEALSQFSQQVANAYAVEDILPTMAQIIATATGVTRAEIWLRVGAELRITARWPAGPDDQPGPAAVPVSEGDRPPLPRFGEADRAFPVVHQGESLGTIVVQAPVNDPITPGKEKLIANLAAQAGLVLRNVRLVEDIRASRQRIVTAQDAAARRLERNIHDGAQQQLVALAIKANLAGSLIGDDDDEARDMLGQINAGLHDTLADLRDLARGIYPPLLADHGLYAALAAHATKAALPVTMEGDTIARCPPEAEAAAYFCCLEALQNTAKYAAASHATIRLTTTPAALTFTVSDDGTGFDLGATNQGSGLQGMADRLAALGGHLHIISAPGAGTTITGTIPTNAAPRPRPAATPRTRTASETAATGPRVQVPGNR